MIWVSNNVSLVAGTERVPRFVMALSEDITKRKRAEDALRASEAPLPDAQRLTRTCSWRHEVLSGKVTLSAEGLPVFGNPTMTHRRLLSIRKGAFTEALQRRVGRFELANGGTIVLAENRRAAAGHSGCTSEGVART